MRTQCWRSERSIGSVSDLGLLSQKRTVLESMSRIDKDADEHNGEETVRFSGVNVQVVSGREKTDEDQAKVLSGLGNLIVGYDEGPAREKSGSHNLVVGSGHEYTSHSSTISGKDNVVAAPATTALGSQNVAVGWAATVTGGTGNRAEALAASVTGGSFNIARGDFGTVTSGLLNKASGMWAAASGGRDNEALGEYATTGGGGENVAQAQGSVIQGGLLNMTSGYCSGGDVTTGRACSSNDDCLFQGADYGAVCLDGEYASIVAGTQGRTTRPASSIVGGRGSTASHPFGIKPEPANVGWDD